MGNHRFTLSLALEKFAAPDGTSGAGCREPRTIYNCRFAASRSH
ncbi:hypothetical protein BSIN_0514 [Burkholderia singularis]|uniref:Uncharacterized protein n=1 Tax=Burkholderia singularis TaxID=1503053 RepID=A0A238H7Q7_9BURK|nr:hypothetical protein BSIN_0514 [Burkholderia singularis]